MYTIKNVKVASENCLCVEFSDGKTKFVDFATFFDSRN